MEKQQKIIYFPQKIAEKICFGELTEREIRVYFAFLKIIFWPKNEIGMACARKIQLITKLPTNKIYESIKKLEEKGLISRDLRRSKTGNIYSINSTDSVPNDSTKRVPNNSTNSVPNDSTERVLSKPSKSSKKQVKKASPYLSHDLFNNLSHNIQNYIETKIQFAGKRAEIYKILIELGDQHGKEWVEWACHKAIKECKYPAAFASFVQRCLIVQQTHLKAPQIGKEPIKREDPIYRDSDTNNLGEESL